MIPDGFGDPIAGFENPYRQTDPNNSDLTIGHTPWSTSCRPAFAFPSRGHRVSTFAWVLDGGKEATVFISFFLFTNVGLVRVLGHGHGPVLGVVVWVDLDLGWTFGWTCGARKVALPHLRRPW